MQIEKRLHNKASCLACVGLTQASVERLSCQTSQAVEKQGIPDTKWARPRKGPFQNELYFLVTMWDEHLASNIRFRLKAPANLLNPSFLFSSPTIFTPYTSEAVTASPRAGKLGDKTTFTLRVACAKQLAPSSLHAATLTWQIAAMSREQPAHDYLSEAACAKQLAHINLHALHG